MRLSEMTTDQLTDSLLAITAPIANIAGDDEVMEVLNSIGKMSSGTSVVKVGIEIINKIVPLALKKHRADLFQVLAVLIDKPVKVLKAQNAFETIREAKAVIDEDLVRFFTSLAGTEPGAS